MYTYMAMVSGRLHHNTPHHHLQVIPLILLELATSTLLHLVGPQHHIVIHSRGHPVAGCGHRYHNQLRRSLTFSDLRQPLRMAKTLLSISFFELGLLHPSSVAAKKMSLVFKSGYLKEGWKWEYVFFTWDLPMSFAIYDAWCRRAAIRYTGNIYLIAKKRIAPVYLTEEVFEHYKRMRATDEAFKKKSEQMSSNRKSEVGGRDRLEEMSTQTPDASIDEDAVFLEVVPEVKGRVYGLGSQGYHRGISSGGASSSRGPAYGLQELEELQRDHQRLQETLLKERMERQEQMQKDKMERQEETREMQDRLARMEALLMQHLGIRPHVPPDTRTPPSPRNERSVLGVTTTLVI
ncbi:hypothetical protein Scep_014330 [Stephania cephalantha]|uniref:Transposase n=1 Tax=Stephania cephalantha TaxID=152367 RepID=A0AAP0P0G4_9MAGN